MSNTAQAKSEDLAVDIFSDVVCPWCYIGKVRFEQARTLLADGFEGNDPIEVAVRYRAFQLDPTAPVDDPQPVVGVYAKKFGDNATQILEQVTHAAAEVGLEFHMDRALRANTLRAHRLIWLAGNPDAAAPDAGVTQAAMATRLMRAYFTEGLDIGDHDTLVRLAHDVGFETAVIDEFLRSSGGIAEVAAELSMAAERGVTAVPTFVVADRWAIPGAQDAETLARLLSRVASGRVDAASTD